MLKKAFINAFYNIFSYNLRMANVLIKKLRKMRKSSTIKSIYKKIL